MHVAAPQKKKGELCHEEIDEVRLMFDEEANVGANPIKAEGIL